MLFFSKPKSYIGIDLGAGGVKLVELRKEKNRPVLFTYGLTSEPQDIHHLVVQKDKTAQELTVKNSDAKAQAAPNIEDARVEKYIQMVKAVCHSAKTVSKLAVSSLPVSSVFQAVVTMPKVEKSEVDHILKAEVKKLLPRPLEEMALDYQPLPMPKEANVSKFLIHAVPREIVVFYSKVCRGAGLTLDSLEPESTALARALVGKDNGVNMIIDIGAERTNFFMVDSGVPVTHHSIESGGQKIDRILKNILGVDDNLVEKIKFDLFGRLNRGQNASGWDKNKFLEIFMPVLDPIIKEIEFSFDVYFHQSGNEGKRPEKIILTGGGGFLPFLPEFIADKFKLKCYVGDPWGRVLYQDGLKGLLGQIGPRMSVAIGLALRNIV